MADPTRLPTPDSRLPLEGVRVADITVVWAGPHVTQLLAEWGAEVIRVEPVTRIQPSTRWAERQSTREMEEERGRLGIATGGGYPDSDPGDQPWNRNSGFNSHARNKRSMACDVMTAEGRAHFLELIATCDVLVENNVPDTIEKAGLTYEELRRVKPELVMLRMPAYGLSGPYRGYRAFGTHLEGLIGHHAVRGYPDGTPDEGGEVYTADAAAGVQGAFAVMLALYHRERTGEGQQIELAQAENFLPMLAELILDWTMNGNDPGPWGNRHRSRAPHGVYPCRGNDVGGMMNDEPDTENPLHRSSFIPHPSDSWITIDVGTDAEFAALCAVLGCGSLVEDARFADPASRLAHRDELDPLIAGATRQFEPFDLFHRLQAAGVAAGPLPTAAERLACPQLNARGFFEELENEATGRRRYPGLIWRMTQTPNRLRRAPVMLGQDNDYVYRDLIGIDEAEYQRLCDAGAVGTRYLPSAFAASRD